MLPSPTKAWNVCFFFWYSGFWTVFSYFQVWSYTLVQIHKMKRQEALNDVNSYKLCPAALCKPHKVFWPWKSNNKCFRAPVAHFSGFLRISFSEVSVGPLSSQCFFPFTCNHCVYISRACNIPHLCGQC